MPIITPEAPVDTTWTNVDQKRFDAFLDAHPAAIATRTTATQYPNEEQKPVDLATVSYYLTDSAGDVLLAQSNAHTLTDVATGVTTKARDTEYLIRTILLS